jgi:hypothetical protein
VEICHHVNATIIAWAGPSRPSRVGITEFSSSPLLFGGGVPMARGWAGATLKRE